MGEVKKETKKKVETPACSKKIKKLNKDLDKLGDWVADMMKK